MNENISFEELEFLEGLQEAVSDAEGKLVTGVKKDNCLSCYFKDGMQVSLAG